MRTTSSIESILKKDRALVLAGVVAVAALAWAYLFYLAWEMRQDMSGMSMPGGMNLAMTQVRAWTGVDFLLMFLMWVVMMTAMMVPTAAPMILTFATINRKRLEQQQPYVPTGVFLLGYLLVWSAFAAAATAAQWGLNTAALLSPMMASSSTFLGGGLLLAAGIFQWSPLKYACLSHCRTPLGFIMTEWREGTKGALNMGLRHRGLLSGLLLGVDGATVRVGGDESAVDRRPGWVCPNREDNPRRTLGEPNIRCCANNLGSLDGGWSPGLGWGREAIAS